VRALCVPVWRAVQARARALRAAGPSPSRAHLPKAR
jgi:hypothetical protein